MSDQLPDIATLFATDPLKLSRDDLSRIIAKYRENWSAFRTTGAASVVKPKSEKVQAALSLASKLNLEGL